MTIDPHKRYAGSSGSAGTIQVEIGSARQFGIGGDDLLQAPPEGELRVSVPRFARFPRLG